jgi:hypothetical protein
MLTFMANHSCKHRSTPLFGAYLLYVEAVGSGEYLGPLFAVFCLSPAPLQSLIVALYGGSRVRLLAQLLLRQSGMLGRRLADHPTWKRRKASKRFSRLEIEGTGVATEATGGLTTGALAREAYSVVQTASVPRVVAMNCMGTHWRAVP